MHREDRLTSQRAWIPGQRQQRHNPFPCRHFALLSLITLLVACTGTNSTPFAIMPVLSTDSTGLVSPEINANHTVTLRLRSAIATSTIAMWSSAIFDDPSVLLARLIAAPENLKHSFLYVHVGVGQQDTLYASSSAMDNFLTSQKIDHEFTPTPGTHSWLLWRSYLVDFLPKFSAVAQ